ncbi:hypothetical protein NC651_013256 [Populus alba x Populus x berolinensis]|nr:hypothetical protein NC651_013256 [Populus alba x Populus x berolinensis]
MRFQKEIFNETNFLFADNNLGYLRIFTFKMHHRFSASFKNYAGLTRNWPGKRSFEYYATLAHRNQMLRGRRLSDVVSALIAFFSHFSALGLGRDERHCCSHGLFGRGMEKISAPGVLSREGLIADSFSIKALDMVELEVTLFNVNPTQQITSLFLHVIHHVIPPTLPSGCSPKDEVW